MRWTQNPERVFKIHWLNWHCQNQWMHICLSIKTSFQQSNIQNSTFGTSAGDFITDINALNANSRTGFKINWLTCHRRINWWIQEEATTRNRLKRSNGHNNSMVRLKKGTCIAKITRGIVRIKKFANNYFERGLNDRNQVRSLE